jgi:hypothetical protein
MEVFLLTTAAVADFGDGMLCNDDCDWDRAESDPDDDEEEEEMEEGNEWGKGEGGKEGEGNGKANGAIFGRNNQQIRRKKYRRGG